MLVRSVGVSPGRLLDPLQTRIARSGWLRPVPDTAPKRSIRIRLPANSTELRPLSVPATGAGAARVHSQFVPNWSRSWLTSRLFNSAGSSTRS